MANTRNPNFNVVLQGEARDKLRERVVKILGPILVASKGGLEIENVQRDFREMEGESIPWRPLGYSSLEDFLVSGKDFCYMTHGRGTVLVHPVVKATSEHIIKMVSKQRSNTRKKPSKVMRAPAHRHPFNWQPRQGGGRPVKDNWGPQIPSVRTGPGHFHPMPFGGHPMWPRNGGPQGWGGSYRGRNGQPQRRPTSAPNGYPGPSPSAGRGPSGGPRPTPSSTRSSHGSSGRQAASPTSPQPPLLSASLKKELEDYCRALGLPTPTYKPTPCGRKFISTVIVGERRFKTFPAEYPTSEQADLAAAKEALAHFKKSVAADGDTLARNGPVAQPPSDEKLAEIEGRLSQLVEGRTNGVWSKHLERDYTKKFGKSLPVDWPKRLMTAASRLTRIHIEPSAAMEDMYILTPRKKDEELDGSGDVKATETQARPSNLVVAARGPVSEESSTTSGRESKTSVASPATKIVPPHLPSHGIFPELKFPGVDDFWNLYITHVESTTKVYGRLLGEEYADVFDALITEMELHFFDEDKYAPVEKPQVGRAYAVKFDDEWHRVLVTSVFSEGVAVVYFVDTGRRQRISGANLLELDSKFTTLPTQAFAFSLAGLEQLADSESVLAELESHLDGRSFVAEVQGKDGQHLSLILNDTSTEDDVNMNEVLIERFSTAPPPLEKPLSPNGPFNGQSSHATSYSSSGSVEKTVQQDRYLANVFENLHVKPVSVDQSLPPDLASLKELVPATVPSVGEFFDVNVTLAASPFHFEVQSWAEGEKLEEMQRMLQFVYSSAEGRAPPLATNADINRDKYFAARHTDNMWYRVRLNSIIDEDMVAVRFVDFGDLGTVSRDHLRLLASSFRNLPMQAIQAKLADIVPINGDWTSEDSLWFMERVVNKQFVSRVRSATYEDNEDGPTLRLTLNLIDTTHPTKDSYVEQELVAANRAALLIY